MFGSLLGAWSSAMSQQAQMQQAMMTAQKQQMAAQEAIQRRDMRAYDDAFMLARDRHGAKVERVQGVFRCVIEAPTRIPQHPRQGGTR